eukprot:jgi/Astpho2/916/fgenesh1_pg.00016_%23_112_t
MGDRQIRDPSRNPALAAKLEQERLLKAGISNHKTGLPPKLLELFEARPALEKLTPVKKRAPKVPYTGIGQFVALFPEPGDPDYEPEPENKIEGPRVFRNPEMPTQAQCNAETRAEKEIRLQKERQQQAQEAIAQALEDWDPKSDSHATSEAYNTLFVARVSHETTEKKLKREFEEYGPIRSVVLVHDKQGKHASTAYHNTIGRCAGKSRGYAFIEFEHKADMKEAYKRAEGKKLDGRRLVVDVERGRTTQNWRPRRLGGGKGGEGREAKEPKNPAKRIKKGLPPLPPGGAVFER